jgi:ribosome-associated protein
MGAIEFALRGDFITLNALLKASGLADSGGRAKALVAAGLVQVDGQPELRKACKLRAGQVVALAGTRLRLVVAPARAGIGAHGTTELADLTQFKAPSHPQEDPP